MQIAPRTLLQMVRDNARLGDDAWLRFVDVTPGGELENRTFNYSELLSRAERLANAMKSAGLRSGERFAILMRNRPAFVEAMLAAEILGAQFVSIDPRIGGDKLAKMLRFAECRGVFVCPEGWESLKTAGNVASDMLWTWSSDPVEDPLPVVGDLLAEYEPLRGEPGSPGDVMQLIFTSSTTGDAKAIVITYERFAQTTAMAATAFGFDRNDILYAGLSLTHANAQFISLGAAAALGIPAVISTKFTKSRLWEILTKNGCTVFNLLGGMTSAIFSEPPSSFEDDNPVRLVISAGMPVPIWRRFEDRFDVRIFEFYGTAEGGLLFNPPDTGPIGSIGKPPPGLVCEIVDDSGTVCAPGERGEICFRKSDGSLPEVQYFKNPEASAAKHRDGWFSTGDIGYTDDEGWFFFSHRAGRSIRRNGDFVDTSAIEALLADHPSVDDVYIYGIRTDQLVAGERNVVAAVELRIDAVTEPKELMAFCRRELGTIGAPDYLQIVREIPKTASEKPRDRDLVALINEGRSEVFDKSGRVTIEANEGREENA